MAARSAEDLLDYYKRELAYLRGQGADFARSYPQVAHMLELEKGQSSDPHVERLIEAVAFLAARVHRDLDNEFPQISSALLGLLYPSLVTPLPSISIAQFEVDLSQGKLTTGYQIPKLTPLASRSVTYTPAGNTPGSNAQCRFRTCYPVTLWPIKVADARFVPVSDYNFLDKDPGIASILRIRLQCLGQTNFQEMELSSLRFHLHGDLTEVMPLYELLLSSVKNVIALPEAGSPIKLPKNAIQEVGFGAEEEVLSSTSNAHSSYQLLQEYFAFPRKFLFFDINHLKLARGQHTSVDILFLLNKPKLRGISITSDNIKLGCTPIINLFRKTTEPLRIDHRKYEYRLVPDWRDESFTEIHTINTVTATDRESAGATTVQPYYEFNHGLSDDSTGPYWFARRDECHRPEIAGTDVWLSFLDLNFKPEKPDFPIIYANTTCTNRHLAEQVPAGAELIAEAVVASASITCLYKPTPQLSPQGGREQWRLISMLTLNNVSLFEENASLQNLREMLALYNVTDSASANEQIRGINSMKCESVVRRVGRDAWRGFCRGYEITLEFNESAYAAGSALLLAAVLNRFFAQYTSVNSFTQVVVKRDVEEWKRWEPMTGRQPVI